jgi:hypothetical protein
MRRLTGICIISMLGFFMACGADTLVAPLDEGWTAWENQLYPEAHAKFTEAGGAEGLNGLGWTTLKMDSMDRAEIYFALSVSDGNGDTLSDAAAGLAISAWQQGDYAISLEAAKYVLRKDENYAFPHEAAVNKEVILRAKGYDEYHLLQYANCIATIQILDNTFTASVSDPNIASILLTKLNTLSGTGS